jgi:CRP-like cAMP-binding protein
MAQAAHGRVSHSLVKALRSVPDFAALDDRTLVQLVGASMNLAYSAGSVVFEPGLPSEALYIVLSGEVGIFDNQDGREVEVSRVGPVESFGELSLLLGRQHSKKSMALQDTELMIIPRQSFQEVLATNPDLQATFERRLEERRTVSGQVAETEAPEGSEVSEESGSV